MKTTAFQKTVLSTFTGIALLGSANLFAANDVAAKHETGKIISVDAKTHTLVVEAKAGQKPETFQGNDKTKVNVHGTKGARRLADHGGRQVPKLASVSFCPDVSDARFAGLAGSD